MDTSPRFTLLAAQQAASAAKRKAVRIGLGCSALLVIPALICAVNTSGLLVPSLPWLTTVAACSVVVFGAGLFLLGQSLAETPWWHSIFEEQKLNTLPTNDHAMAIDALTVLATAPQPIDTGEYWFDTLDDLRFICEALSEKDVATQKLTHAQELEGILAQRYGSQEVAPPALIQVRRFVGGTQARIEELTQATEQARRNIRQRLDEVRVASAALEVYLLDDSGTDVRAAITLKPVEPLHYTEAVHELLLPNVEIDLEEQETP